MFGGNPSTQRAGLLQLNGSFCGGGYRDNKMNIEIRMAREMNRPPSKGYSTRCIRAGIVSRRRGNRNYLQMTPLSATFNPEERDERH